MSPARSRSSAIAASNSCRERITDRPRCGLPDVRHRTAWRARLSTGGANGVTTVGSTWA